MNYRISLNLMRLRGAKLCSVTLDGKPVNCLVVPVQDNHISVTVDPKTRQPKDAYFNLLADAPSDAYYDKVLHENPNAKLPRHMVYNNPSQESRKRMEKHMEQKLRNDQQYMAQHPSDDDIAKRAKYGLRNELYLGRAYSLEAQNEYRGSAPKAETGDYQPTKEEMNQQQQPSATVNQYIHESTRYDDLPF